MRMFNERVACFAYRTTSTKLEINAKLTKMKNPMNTRHQKTVTESVKAAQYCSTHDTSPGTKCATTDERLFCLDRLHTVHA